MPIRERMLHYETQAQNQGLRFVLGVDEAGRGPLAGPVVAAAVCLREFDFKAKINDSKQMTPLEREKAFHEIFDKAYVGLGTVGEAAIDIVNILNASHLAMELAVKHLVRRMPHTVSSDVAFNQSVLMLIDGNIFRAQLPYRHQTIVGGDAKSASIACASIIAKVYRDSLLKAYHKVYPQYGFDRHKGYPTSGHYEALRLHGPSMLHRRTFQGVA